MPPLRQTISFGATPRPEQPQGANWERTDLSSAAILLCYVSESFRKVRPPVKASENAVLKATTRRELPEGTKPLSGVTNAMADDFRGWFAVAGPELTPNQFHFAIVGARELSKASPTSMPPIGRRPRKASKDIGYRRRTGLFRAWGTISFNLANLAELKVGASRFSTT